MWLSPPVCGGGSVGLYQGQGVFVTDPFGVVWTGESTGLSAKNGERDRETEIGVSFCWDWGESPFFAAAWEMRFL